VETKQIIDPNYVLDEKGKAHYLFDKKNSNGQVEKTFRTHSKHGGGGNTSASESSPRPRSTRAKAAPAVNDKKSKKRKRRGNRWDSDDDESDDFEDYNDNSGTFTMSNWGTTKRTRTRASTRATTDVGSEGSGEMDQDEDEYDSDAPDASNPLPGFVDPITLDEVVKPAISKYGHVMGYVIGPKLWSESDLTQDTHILNPSSIHRYDSWVRCLTNWEGKRNICPLTKKPLTKRDLVILDHDNIVEYRYGNFMTRLSGSSPPPRLN
jgi:hypothetical protein